MTNDEAIKIIKAGGWGYPENMVTEANLMAIEALRSKSEAEGYRTPKKIIRVLAIDGTLCYGCPTCHGSVKYPLPYCLYCGQALDWSEVEE